MQEIRNYEICSLAYIFPYNFKTWNVADFILNLNDS